MVGSCHTLLLFNSQLVYQSISFSPFPDSHGRNDGHHSEGCPKHGLLLGFRNQHMFFCKASDSLAQRHGEPDQQNTTRSVVFIDELLKGFARDDPVF